MKLKFCGADRTVTGSQHLLELNGKKILLDCGLYQGRREEAYEVNKNFLFDPSELHCVVLSHAHIDHSGNLPTLYKRGFTRNVYSTPATRDLCAIMLQDSAFLQEKDVEYVNKKRLKKGEHSYKPLYGIEDVRPVMENFKAMPYNNKFYIDGLDGKVAVTFIDAGHILGSAQIILDLEEKGKKVRFGFTGDLGRPNLPILRDPAHMGDVDYIISESTYGGRIHDKSELMTKQLSDVVNTAVKNCGKIIVPAFSVGRTQEIVYALNELFKANAIPKIPVFVDSPLSVDATEVFKLHPDCFDEETSELIASGVDVFGLSNVTYIRSVEESKKLNNFNECCMIISASGMCEGGRILHHLKNSIENYKTTVLIVGFMAEHTLGRRLVEARDQEDPKVKIFGDTHEVNAKIVVLNSFSAHADRNELLDYFDKFNRDRLRSVFLVHGELDQQEALKEGLTDKGFRNILIPEKGEEVNI
ncbi:MAG: MBL fold metallo-hydrolase [Ignavibacteriae bacterium]|nr:MBL fold metallo-hydrolase [Ignavibacteriota bacterium]MCB9244195.1 MBL fold metallo-hydrolase [Ignavibacteriales bacterium]